MKIHIVEDEAICIAEVHALLQKWEKERNVSVELQSFPSGDAFLRQAKEEADLIFLDIQMKGIDGLTLARRLRAQGYQGQLVFLTSFSDYVFEGYDVQALNYCLKPISYDKLCWCMDIAQRKLVDEHYIYRLGASILKLPYSHILYFSSANHQIEILTTEGSHRQSEKLRNILTRLPERFRRCHRGMIVNMEHILMLNGNELTLSNQRKVPVSQPYLEDIRSALFAYANEMR